MNEVTPDLIAAIATRLYNEIPGANLIPKTEAETPPAVPEAVGWPAGFPALPANTVSLPAGADVSPAVPVTPSVQETTSDGLKAFVQRIRSSQLRSKEGRCADDPSQDYIRRLFAGKSVTARGISAPGRSGHPPGFSRPEPAGAWPASGLAGQRRDDPETAERDRLAGQLLRPRQLEHPPRSAHAWRRATDAFEQARQKVQTFLGASSAKEIVFVRGSTEAINLVAQSYGRKFLQPGDEIVLSTLEHHANIVPWQQVAREKGAVLRVIPVTDRGEIMLEEYQRLLGARTKVVALTHASNSLGTILPVAEMTQMAKRYGARVLIDGAQSVAHIPVNLQQLGADFFVFSGHKIFGPTGIGVVYAKEELWEIMPPWQGGGNMIKNVTFEETTFAEPPAKFEAGTPNVADAVGLGAALDYVNRLGLPNIAKYEHELLQYATEQLSRINGLRLIGTAREKVGVLSFVLPDRPTEEVGRLLDLEGIAVRAGHHCAQPSLRRFGLEATVRPSLAFYNTTGEIDRLADAVKRILRK